MDLQQEASAKQEQLYNNAAGKLSIASMTSAANTACGATKLIKLGEISKWADENLRLFLRTVRRSKKCFSC
jgi:hypothetical protein